MQSELFKTLDEIAARAEDCTILHSINYGDIEAWNLVCCYLQNAEMEGNDPIAHIECTLSFESDDVQAYFRALGVKF